MENKYTPCSGCGATDPIDRCIGCFHPFEQSPKPQPKIEVATWLNLADYFTEDWETMHCRYADDKRKLDTDLFELSDGWLIKKGGTGKLELHEVEYMADTKETNMENKYPIGGYAPGNYQCRCSTCNFSFLGDKRAVQCESCAIKDKERFDALSPEEQDELIKRNAQLANEMLSGKLTPEQIEERKKAVEWYRNPGGEDVILVLIPCEENDPRAVGGYTSYDGRSLCHVREGHVPVQNGPVWVKVDQKPEHNAGVLILIPGEDNHITSGMWDISGEWVLLDEYRIPDCEVTHWMPLPDLPDDVERNDLPDWFVTEIKRMSRDELGLDKNPSLTPSKESDVIAPFEFTEWAVENAWFDEEYRLWNFYEEDKMVDGQFRFTTKEFYELFLKQKEVKP